MTDDHLHGQAPPCNAGGGQSRGYWLYCDQPAGHDGNHAAWSAILKTQVQGFFSGKYTAEVVATRTEWEDDDDGDNPS